MVIASPTGEHVAHALAALDAGSARPRRQAAGHHRATTREMLAAARRRPPLTVFQNRRWDPEQLTLRGLLAAEQLGTVHRFERRWERFRPVPQDRWKENDPGSPVASCSTSAPHLVDSATSSSAPSRPSTPSSHARTTPAVDDVFLALVHASRASRATCRPAPWSGAPGSTHAGAG